MHRMNTFVLFLIAIGAGSMQATALNYLSVAGAKPDLLLIFMCFIALYEPIGTVIKAAFLTGLVRDCLSPSIFGSYTLSFICTGLILYKYQQQFYRESIPVQVLVCAASYILAYSIVRFCVLISPRQAVFYPYSTSMVIRGALYTGSIAPLIFFLFYRLFHLRPRTSI